MLNTMAMSVLERTQEIGILRAVGWPRGRVIRMVLGEAVLSALAAAAVGHGRGRRRHLCPHALAAGERVHRGRASLRIGDRPGVRASPSLIGLLGGAYPAFRAARLLAHGGHPP